MSKVGSFSLHIFLLSRSNGYVIMHSYYLKATEANQKNPTAVEVTLVVHVSGYVIQRMEQHITI